MAVKRSTRVKSDIKDSPVEIIDHLAPIEKKVEKKDSSIKSKIAGAVVLVAAMLGIFWYKTGTWPIVAMVGMKPITRFEINQTLYGQYGKEAVENIITEALVANELNRLGVSVSDEQVQEKITEIKASLGEEVDLTTLLTERGMTQKEFEDQLRLQLRVEKAMMDKVVISEEEVSQYLETNSQFMTATGEAAVTQAKEALKYSKLQEEVNKWLEELKSKANVWRAPGV